MSFHNIITQEEINLVEERLEKQGFEETAQAWYDRNVNLVGEEQAVRRFKNKANNQRIGK